TDVQQLVVTKEEDDPLSLDQGDPPEPPHIKEEQEEVWTSREQLQGLDQADIIKFTFFPVTVKTEDEDDDGEKKPQSSQLRQRQTEDMKPEADGEDCGRPEPDRDSDPDHHNETSHPSEPETDDSCEWETREPLQNNEEPGNVQKLMVTKEESDPSSLDQDDPPESPHIKEEQEDFWTSREQLQGLDEADIIKFTFFPVTVKTEDGEEEEDDEDKPQFTRLYQLKNHQCVGDQSSQLIEAHDEPEPDSLSNPDTDDDTSDSSESESDDSDDSEDTSEPEGDLDDVQQLVVTKEEDDPVSLDQDDPPTLLHIKEEQEDFWTSREQLRGLQEADIKFTFFPVAVKSEEEEDDEEKPQSSQLQQRQTEDMKPEADGEDCGGPEPDKDSDQHLQPDIDVKTSHSSEPESDDSWDWEDTREPPSGLNSPQNNEEPGRDLDCNTVKTSTRFEHDRYLQKHNKVQIGEKPFKCSVCGKRYSREESYTAHMKLHSEGKHFSCSFCKKTFQQRGNVVTHMRIHTGEKPFSCPFCDRKFARSSTLTSHMRVHTGEKPFSCSVCKASFSVGGKLSEHMRIHTGEKPFSCSDCGKTFARREHLTQHLSVHTGKKPFSCSVC
ncbi:Gastrula zinc finger protein XlCGF57.1, partial [Nibea albiflora]